MDVKRGSLKRGKEGFLFYLERLREKLSGPSYWFLDLPHPHSPEWLSFNLTPILRKPPPPLLAINGDVCGFLWFISFSSSPLSEVDLFAMLLFLSVSQIVFTVHLYGQTISTQEDKCLLTSNTQQAIRLVRPLLLILEIRVLLALGGGGGWA